MICVTLLEPTIEKTIEAMKQAAEHADIIELRLDALRETIDLKALLEAKPKPVIVAARPLDEGGSRTWKSPAERLELLHQAVELGADIVDVELRTGPQAIKQLVEKKKNSAILVSWHTFLNTPKRTILRARIKEAYAAGADICKLVTLAHDPLDNGRVLELVATSALRERKHIIGFCMGELGRISRVATLFMGGMLTYCYLDKPAAAGMFSVGEMKRLLAEYGFRKDWLGAPARQEGPRPS